MYIAYLAITHNKVSHKSYIKKIKHKIYEKYVFVFFKETDLANLNDQVL